MNRRIIYSRSDGGVSMITPCRCIDENHLTNDLVFQRAWDRLQRDIDPLSYYKAFLRNYVEGKLTVTDKIKQYLLGIMDIPTGISDEQLTSYAQQYMDKFNIKPLDAINPQIITVDDIPQDRYFRNAWEHGDDKVVVNMNLAREIHLERIRIARNEKLAALDVETMKAVGKGDDQARDEVEAQKQILRDIPQTLDLSKATTPEELRAIWPAELN